MSAKSHKIIGIGAAGCNFVQACWQSVDFLNSSRWMPDFICIDLDLDVLNYVNAHCAATSDCAPIKTLLLATFGASGRVNRARAETLRKRDDLRALLANTEMVCLVAGLGGGTGSGVTPILANLARAAGALTVAAVITPFDFEGEARRKIAATAMKYLNREADLVSHFSNEALMNVTGGSILQDVFFDRQNQRIAKFLQSLMNGTIDAART